MSILRIRLAGAAAAALTIGACDQPPTAPSASSAAPPTAAATFRSVSNAVKYRDAGQRPATGRSGSATLTVTALLGMTGTTAIDVAAGSVTGAGNPLLTKVQLVGSTPTGAHLFTMNDNDLSVARSTFSLAGLSRTGRVRVHANIRGVDGARTNVVVVDQRVVLRPDIAVTAVTVPGEVWTQTPTMVSATLRELNGDVGAWATCLLELDGAPVDSAAGVWIDANGTVSCAFAILLTEPGTHSLAVRATNVVPGDWNTANNAASATVNVGRDLPLAYDAAATDDSVRKWTMQFTDFTAGGATYHSQVRDSSSTAGRTQSASLTAFTREIVEFPEEPLREVHLAQRTGTSTVHEADYDMLPADNITTGPNWTSGCVSRSDGAIVTWFSLCSRRETNDGIVSSYTSLTYTWNAGDVTYRSVGYSLVACSLPGSPPCTPSSYSWNTTTPNVHGRAVAFGTTYAFEAGFRSGLTRFSADPVVPLSPTYSITQAPLFCQPVISGYYPPAGRFGFLTTCAASREEHWRLSGVGVAR